MKINTRIVFLILATLLYMCKPEHKNIEPQENQNLNLNNFITIADTIINDVVIKNPDNDDWTSYCLRHLDRETLINDLFDLVYSEKLVPYDFFTDEVLSIADIKLIESEEEYSRENVAKVQFEESWSFDKDTQAMVKKVHSVMIAYELFTSEGKVKGYKPIFKVYLN